MNKKNNILHHEICYCMINQISTSYKAQNSSNMVKDTLFQKVKTSVTAINNYICEQIIIAGIYN